MRFHGSRKSEQHHLRPSLSSGGHGSDARILFLPFVCSEFYYDPLVDSEGFLCACLCFVLQEFPLQMLSFEESYMLLLSPSIRDLATRNLFICL